MAKDKSIQKIVDRAEKLIRMAVDQEGTPEGASAGELARRFLKRHGLTRSDLTGSHDVGIPVDRTRRWRWRGRVCDIIAWSIPVGSGELDGMLVLRGDILSAAQAIHEIRYFCNLIADHAGRFERGVDLAKGYVESGTAFPSDVRAAQIEHPWESFTETAVAALMDRYFVEDEDGDQPDVDLDEVRAQLLEQILDDAAKDDGEEYEEGGVSDRAAEEQEAEPDVETDYIERAVLLIRGAVIPPRAIAEIAQERKMLGSSLLLRADGEGGA